MEPRNEDQETTLEVLAGMVKDAITRITELEIRIAELEAQVGERTAELDTQVSQLQGDAINPS